MSAVESEAPRNALNDLVESTLDLNDWSANDVARRAQAAGYALDRSDISNMRHQLKLLSPRKLEALAVGLSLPPSVVARAALETTGIPMPDVITPEQAIEADFTLPALTRQNLLAVLASARQG